MKCVPIDAFIIAVLQDGVKHIQPGQRFYRHRILRRETVSVRELTSIYLCQFSFLCYDNGRIGRHNIATIINVLDSGSTY